LRPGVPADRLIDLFYANSRIDCRQLLGDRPSEQRAEILDQLVGRTGCIAALVPACLDILLPASNGFFEWMPSRSRSHASRISWVSHSTTPSILCPFGIRPSATHSSNLVVDTASDAAASSLRKAKRGNDKSRGLAHLSPHDRNCRRPKLA